MYGSPTRLNLNHITQTDSRHETPAAISWDRLFRSFMSSWEGVADPQAKLVAEDYVRLFRSNMLTLIGEQYWVRPCVFDGVVRGAVAKGGRLPTRVWMSATTFAHIRRYGRDVFSPEVLAERLRKGWLGLYRDCVALGCTRRLKEGAYHVAWDEVDSTADLPAHGLLCWGPQENPLPLEATNMSCAPPAQLEAKFRELTAACFVPSRLEKVVAEGLLTGLFTVLRACQYPGVSSDSIVTAVRAYEIRDLRANVAVSPEGLWDLMCDESHGSLRFNGEPQCLWSHQLRMDATLHGTEVRVTE